LASLSEGVLIMGQHKYNKTALLAKEGKIAPKPKPISERELERGIMMELYYSMLNNLYNPKKKGE